MKRSHGWIAFVLLLLAVAGITTSATLLLNRNFLAGEHDVGMAWAVYGDGSARQKFTKAEYDWAKDLEKKGYGEMTVEQFTAGVCAWQDEDAFHKAEDALQNLRWGLGADDPLYAFVRRPLRAAMDILSCKHYAGTCKRWTPSFGDAALFTRQEDVYGDPYTVFQAEAEYTVFYTLEDESAVTMKELEALLDSYQSKVQAFLAEKTEKQLAQEASMEKQVAALLPRIDRELSTDRIALTGTRFDAYNAWR